MNFLMGMGGYGGMAKDYFDMFNQKKNESKNQNEFNVNDWMKNYLQGYSSPQYQQSPVFQQAMDAVSGRMGGMSQQEMDNYWNNATADINKQYDQNVKGTLRGLNSRGLLNSDSTTEGLNKAGDTYSKNMAYAKNNLYNMNEARKDNAISQAMGLSQMDANNWYNQQNLNMMPWQMALQYMTGIQLPMQQMKYNKDAADRQAESQDDAGFWGALGDIAGAVLPFLF